MDILLEELKKEILNNIKNIDNPEFKQRVKNELNTGEYKISINQVDKLLKQLRNGK